ncbi:hypothetical protein HZ994_18680 [Akkermansiaceae bacterium]|nr:hypothetical protein HZ994_18680 [Akkermansiaceae bacterium]
MKICHTASLALAASLLAATSAYSESKPVKVYIMAGQSNMVGIGQVNGGGTRWGGEFTDPVLSVYEGEYDPAADYDALKAVSTLKLESFGGTSPTPYPGGGVQVVRGEVAMPETGVYEFRPGYGASADNIMMVDGKEVYRKEAGKNPVHVQMKLEAGKKLPFKITYLNKDAGGLGWYARVDIPGTLSTVVKQDGKFPHLIDEDGNWKSRDDVYYKGVVTATADKWLAPGCGAGENNIGPELGFGNIIGDYHEEPVLLLKASQGNRSLAWDFLPPGSERFEIGDTVYAGYKDTPDSWKKGTEPVPVDWYAGKQYDDCFQAAHEVLKNFDGKFPDWKERGYEIAGFVWWQGHKDQGSAVHAERYEQNLVRLIKSLREEFKAPDAPFVVGTIGFGGWEMAGNAVTVANAQLAVSGEKGKYPEFKGNVKSVETRDFWRPADQSPKDQDFHYNQNAETYMLVGEALGKGMLELLEKK